MSLENWLKVCRLDYYLLNKPHPYVDLICLGQDWAMLPQNQHLFRNGSFHQKAQRNGQRLHATSQRSFKGKNKKETCQNKRQQLSETPTSHIQMRNDDKPTVGSLVHGEEHGEDYTLRANALGIKALHKQWKSDDMDGLLWDNELVARQKQQCKQVGSVIFGFTLQKAQVDAVWTLFYEQRDLLLLAKTGFGKSLIFQLLPFMFEPTGVVIILMPLKLLQAEQNSLINRITSGKAIALTGENNQKAV